MMGATMGMGPMVPPSPPNRPPRKPGAKTARFGGGVRDSAMEAHLLPSRDSATFLLEGQPARPESRWRAFASASVTLTLGILGSSVLPVPFAFSRTGVLLGLLVSLLVGAANSLTGTLLLRAAGHLEEHTFEAVAGRGAGKGWKLLTEVSMLVLLFGTLCGDYALLADCGKRALLGLFPDHPPWITAGDGRIPMVALGLCIVFPLACMKRMRSLEYAAMAGVGLVVVLAGVIMHAAISTGFPAIQSGELPLFDFSITADLPEAVAVLSFAFYVQPMLLPLLKEMPAGRVGVNLTCRAVQLVTMVVALLVYGAVGVFAAARYGLKTEGDILVNQWLPGRWDGALDGLVAIYLSLSMAPMVMTMRYQLDSLITGDYGSYLLRRELSLTVFCMLTSLAVAMAWPTAAEKMFAVTGATGVCLVCYVIPVAIHLSLYFKAPPKPPPRRNPSSFCFPPGAAPGGSSPALAALEEATRAGAWAPPRDRPYGGPADGLHGAAPAGPPGEAGAGADGRSASYSGPIPVAAGVGGGAPVGIPSVGGSMPVFMSFDGWLGASHHSRESGVLFSGSYAAGYDESVPSSPRSPTARLYGSSLGGRRGSLDSLIGGSPRHSQLAPSQPQTPQSEAGYQFNWQPAAGAGPLAGRGGGSGGEVLPASSSAGSLGGLGGRPRPRPLPMPALAPIATGRGGGGWASGGLDEPLLSGGYGGGGGGYTSYGYGSAGALGSGSAGTAGQRSAASMGGLSKLGGGGGSRQGGYPSVRDLAGRPRLVQAAALAWHVVVPVFVMLVGTAFCLGSLYLSIVALVR